MRAKGSLGATALMKCSSCKLDVLRTRALFSLVVTSGEEIRVGTYCSACWYGVVDSRGARLLRGTMATIAHGSSSDHEEAVRALR